MECKFCDTFTGICTNADCPMVADNCPVPDTEGICKFEDREEEVYKLTPNGCATVALMDAGMVATMDDPRIDVFWQHFSELMERCGYIQTMSEDTKDD